VNTLPTPTPADPSAEAASITTPTRFGSAAYALAWLPLTALFVAALVANGVPVGQAVRNAVANFLPEALLGLVLVRLPRRFPRGGARSPRFLAALFVTFVAFVAAASAGWLALYRLDAWVFSESWRFASAIRAMPWRLVIDALLFAALLGLAFAWKNAADSRALAAQVARSEALRARAELEALRSQLNPHFILNTFHALVGWVRRDPDVAETAIERLGDLLRRGLRIQRDHLDEVTLRDEWSFAESYLELERLRLGERLRVNFAATPETLGAIVPTFVLQTLVENAVIHAIAPRATGGSITVRAARTAGRDMDRLVLQVEDAVEGAEPPWRESLALVLGTAGVSAGGPSSPNRGPSDHRGVGLSLLRERLVALYDGSAHLKLEHRAGVGTVATIELPFRSLPEGHLDFEDS
jgi:hypothetical protein